jgi:hypothetical protein
MNYENYFTYFVLLPVIRGKGEGSSRDHTLAKVDPTKLTLDLRPTCWIQALEVGSSVNFEESTFAKVGSLLDPSLFPLITGNNLAFRVLELIMIT